MRILGKVLMWILIVIVGIWGAMPLIGAAVFIVKTVMGVGE